MAADEDFDFDFDIPDKEESNEADLANIDQNFLDAIQAKTSDNDCDKANEAFNFWFLILLLVLFMFALIFMVFFLVRGRKAREQYEAVGYRKNRS